MNLFPSVSAGGMGCSECGDEVGSLVVGVVIPLGMLATEGALLVPYRATLDISHEFVECKNETVARLGAAFAISRGIAWRHVDEALDGLVAWFRAPTTPPAPAPTASSRPAWPGGCSSSWTVPARRRRCHSYLAISSPRRTALALPAVQPRPAGLQAAGESAFARLKSWHIMRQACCSIRRISRAGQAIYDLTARTAPLDPAIARRHAASRPPSDRHGTRTARRAPE